jgi:type I restriction enzyme M protein
MVDILNPKLGEKLLDPACGMGGFLTNTIEHLKPFLKPAEDRVTLQETLNGVEKKPLPHMLAMTNVMLHGIDVPSNILHDNTLSRPLRDYGPKDRVDIIITNPIARKHGGSIDSQAHTPGRFQPRKSRRVTIISIAKIPMRWQ